MGAFCEGTGHGGWTVIASQRVGAKRRLMTGSAKQSMRRNKPLALLRRGAPRNDGREGGMLIVSRTNRLDVVAVGIDQERREIGRAVVGARAGAAIVVAAGLQSLAVEFLDRGVIGGTECDVGARGPPVPDAHKATAPARLWAQSPRHCRRANSGQIRAAPVRRCRSARWRRDF